MPGSSEAYWGAGSAGSWGAVGVSMAKKGWPADHTTTTTMPRVRRPVEWQGDGWALTLDTVGDEVYAAVGQQVRDVVLGVAVAVPLGHPVDAQAVVVHRAHRLTATTRVRKQSEAQHPSTGITRAPSTCGSTSCLPVSMHTRLDPYLHADPSGPSRRHVGDRLGQALVPIQVEVLPCNSANP